MTKKDPSGWWEAELKGKVGVIPGNYVEEVKYTPPLPAPPPVPAPVPTAPTPKPSQERQLGVEYNGSKKLLKFSVGSLEALQTSLRQQLSITSSFTVTFFHEDDYYDLDEISLLPEKTKLKIVAQAMN